MIIIIQALNISTKAFLIIFGINEWNSFIPRNAMIACHYRKQRWFDYFLEVLQLLKCVQNELCE